MHPVQLVKAMMRSKHMTNVVHIAGNERQPDKDQAERERSSEGGTERSENLVQQPTTDPEKADENKTPGSGMTPCGGDEAPSG